MTEFQALKSSELDRHCWEKSTRPRCLLLGLWTWQCLFVQQADGEHAASCQDDTALMCWVRSRSTTSYPRATPTSRDETPSICRYY